MLDIKSLVRTNILNLKAYSSARNEYSGSEGTFLDANENPYGNLNRYPDPDQKELKKAIAQMRGITSENAFIGNGSDEIIDLLFRVFCEPGIDKALTFVPTYGMYEVAASINNVELYQQNLDANFDIDTEALAPFLVNPRLKLIIICSPNNPTGNSIDRNALVEILSTFKGIVLIDEAYIDFSGQESLVELINQFPNLIVSQTLSKAWGLASARIGLAFANAEIIGYLNKVKPPYNVSGPNQQVALEALKKLEKYESNKQKIIAEKKRLEARLKEVSCVNKIYPSDANFLLVEVENANSTYAALISKNVIVRNRNKVIDNCIRITVGTPEENERLINALKTI